MIYICIDDTDTLTGPRGTGKLARAIADTVVADYPVFGVTRHQLYVHPDIPYTSHNSDAVIHVQADGDEAMDHLFELAEQVMLGDFLEGSDPGLAVASTDQITSSLIAYGQDAKCTILTQDRARTLAKNLNIRLKGLGGTEDGVIGAMAGLGLAYAKCDGRYLQKGKIRELVGTCTVEDLFQNGVDEVCTLDGRQFTTGTVQLRPDKAPRTCPVFGKTVLFVKEEGGLLVEDKRD
ncbi:ABC transporter substrate-binding protein [uncultured Methanoregula sp.]|uniref:ABC transporter substrate-binding protein n=1 Tax=uncultured Methanoregula sp. TaxID=1005933 RepID=UPI002AAB05E1|nr:ABC transporter substrate-binding protein [uncultured Methanoregula sp.]